MANGDEYEAAAGQERATGFVAEQLKISLDSLSINDHDTLADPDHVKIEAITTRQERATDVAELKEAEQEDISLDSSSIYNHDTLADLDNVKIEAITTGDTPYTSAKRFQDLNLSDELLQGLCKMVFTEPTKIQAISLPLIMTPPYKNLVAQARNGSGKTTCFVLGMLSRVDPNIMAPQALCVCPTRELAIQNLQVLRKMGEFTKITSENAIKPTSESYIPSWKRAPITAQVIIGTPGTVKNAIETKKLDTRHMKILVFDEADHMLAEGGFRDDSMKIMKTIAKNQTNYQVLLFSATFDDKVRDFVSKYFVGGYNEMYVKTEELSLESVKQYKVHCPDEPSKIKVITDQILELGDKVGQTVVFVQTRASAINLKKSLNEIGYVVSTTHGALSQEVRDKMVEEFKDGLTQVLIATDVLARGFDNARVNLVVNFDLPVIHNSRPPKPDYDVYLHRVGRAGRYGRKGAVFNLLCDGRDDQIMGMIEEKFNPQKITEVSPWNCEKEFGVALKNAGLQA